MMKFDTQPTFAPSVEPDLQEKVVIIGDCKKKRTKTNIFSYLCYAETDFRVHVLCLRSSIYVFEAFFFLLRRIYGIRTYVCLTFSLRIRLCGNTRRIIMRAKGCGVLFVQYNTYVLYVFVCIFDTIRRAQKHTPEANVPNDFNFCARFNSANVIRMQFSLCVCVHGLVCKSWNELRVQVHVFVLVIFHSIQISCYSNALAFRSCATERIHNCTVIRCIRCATCNFARV